MCTEYDNLAPIVLFVYNRPEHTKRTVEALQRNNLADRSELFIYSDYAKTNQELDKVDLVRQYIRSIDGFKHVHIVENIENKGLARNIINGVTEVVNKFGKVIVVEDDIVTTPYFLAYMNKALELYKNDSRVYEISGYVEPISPSKLDETFFIRKTYCWGWATWRDRWEKYDNNPEHTYLSFRKKEIIDYNLDGCNSEWNQVVYNLTGKLSTWAIFWGTTVYKNHGLTLVPRETLVTNQGFDGSGTSIRSDYFCNCDQGILGSEITFFPTQIDECDEGRRRIKDFYKSIQPDFLRRIWRNKVLILFELCQWRFQKMSSRKSARIN